MKKIAFLALLGLLSFNFSYAQTGISFEKGTWQQAIAKAQKENKLIFLDAYTSWCGPCKMLQAKVFPDAELGKYFNGNFVNVKVDMEKGEGPELAAKYPIRGYPTLFFIDPKSGKVVNSVLGYKSVDQLMTVGKTVNTRKSI